MNEFEYNLIKQIENDNVQIYEKLSIIDDMSKDDLIKLHGRIIQKIEFIYNKLKNKEIKSNDAYILMEQIKIGLIEMVVLIEEKSN
jgi:hypothetical protein